MANITVIRELFLLVPCQNPNAAQPHQTNKVMSWEVRGRGFQKGNPLRR